MSYADIDRFSFETVTRLIGLVIITVIFLDHVIKKAKDRPVTRSHDNFCSSPNCLRCNFVINLTQLKVKAGRQFLKNPRELERLGHWISDDVYEDEERKPTKFYLPELLSFPVIERGFHEKDVDFLETNWETIAREFEEISSTANFNQTNWTINSTPTGQWSVFYLINQGSEVMQNCKLCPETMTIVKSLDDLLYECSFGNVCFTVLEPGTSISAHYGPCNVRSRCHLGLQIPEGFELLVGSKTTTWSEGNCVLFDDSYFHSVECWRKTSGTRVVLMVDLWHFGLNPHERSAIQEIFPAVPTSENFQSKHE
uniref:Aspartyl/asparaginyl beta-hydroxylase-like n=1 Tax=Phallusia mammillata TaxID=59560 RepID=A0A6F9D7I8_9ASCI|nr:aspartyl/asparaginyl beta-hydroxylase-like [Phallusia mammillata]